MPKLKKTPVEKLDLNFRSAMIGNMELLEYGRTHLEKWLGVSPATLRKKRAEPGKFTLEELRILAQKLDLTPEQVTAFVLGK